MSERYGPYNAHFLAGGHGLTKPLNQKDSFLVADAPWTLSLWYQQSDAGALSTLLAGFGDSKELDSRYLGLLEGKPMLRFGSGNELVASAPVSSSGWHLLAASFDGHLAHLYSDGAEVASGALVLGSASPVLEIAPTGLPPQERLEHYGGQILNFELSAVALTDSGINAMYQHRPDPALVLMEEGSHPWPVQVREQAGYAAPQDPSLMPKSNAPFQKPSAKAMPAASASLQSGGGSRWVLANNWELAIAPEVKVAGADLSQAGFNTKRWLAATVPGTVLTTMVDRGVYADPDFGLNNLAIPESLNKQDYWYRIEFPTPGGVNGRQMTLTFNGINYAADVWLNGKQVGTVKGAFLRGSFDVTALLSRTGKNALAIRVSPPPHPGIPHEQSIKGGAGENGGALCLDGPTFVATEGWDWIPAIRDRNTGIWQDVVLTATDRLKIDDPQVVTHLPLPDTSSAEVDITIPVRNTSGESVTATIHASFEEMRLTKKVRLAPGESTVRLTSQEFPQLHVRQPRLWWPNGYGKPELYHLKIAISKGSSESDYKELRFGIREITYELSLLDPAGKLRRVEVAPTVAHSRGEQIVNVTHDGMRQTADGWAASLTAAGVASPAVRTIPSQPDMNDLVLKVNGVRIAARGGNWGMDDSRKRVSREHLEPFFRLHRDANLNIIRNWVGQDTEEVFYQLADEYGQMVWNDLWSSTQDYNVEPQDPDLFLRNARDVVLRFRNHPSIVMWCGRNEGVPQPIINEGLIAIFRELDGTRYYTPSSNRVNLRNSGPYKYQDPELYYTNLDRGFSVELGIASFSTLESFRNSIAEADQWPISDAWAYHDWHHGGNGDVAPLMRHIEQEFGAATDLKDFERKAQMFNYVDHRAIFEGFNQHLWAPNSGRLLWMTQPAWPSNMWQILSSDYDTQASYYGVKKACEPMHVQLDLSDSSVAVVNTTNVDAGRVSVQARVYSLQNKLLLTRDAEATLMANTATTLFRLELPPILNANGAVLVRLEMKDAAGKLLSDNLYWLAESEADYRKLNTLPAASIATTATSTIEGGEGVLNVRLSNTGAAAALALKLTPADSETGERILPAYFSDNYISLLPGETRSITIRYPTGSLKGTPKIGLRGWNIADTAITVSATP
jgi:hypothetical protein